MLTACRKARFISAILILQTLTVPKTLPGGCVRGGSSGSGSFQPSSSRRVWIWWPSSLMSIEKAWEAIFLLAVKTCRLATNDKSAARWTDISISLLLNGSKKQSMLPSQSIRSATVTQAFVAIRSCRISGPPPENICLPVENCHNKMRYYLNHCLSLEGSKAVL